MNKITFRDLEITLPCDEARLIDYAERFVYENGKKTEQQDGFNLDCFGTFESGRKAFRVKVNKVLDETDGDAIAPIVQFTELRIVPYFLHGSDRVEFSISADSAKILDD